MKPSERSGKKASIGVQTISNWTYTICSDEGGRSDKEKYQFEMRICKAYLKYLQLL